MLLFLEHRIKETPRHNPFSIPFIYKSRHCSLFPFSSTCNLKMKISALFVASSAFAVSSVMANIVSKKCTTTPTYVMPTSTSTTPAYVAPTSTKCTTTPYVSPTNTYVAPSSTYVAPSSTYVAPSSTSYVAPSSTYVAPSSTSYVAPSSTYVAPSSSYVAPTSTETSYVAPTTSTSNCTTTTSSAIYGNIADIYASDAVSVIPSGFGLLALFFLF